MVPGFRLNPGYGFQQERCDPAVIARADELIE
jgi:hypothetical protein